MTDLFTPPRYFKNVPFHRHTDRAVGWLELFYDLVYVATLIQIGNFLSDNTNWLGFGQFIVLMAVVWWAWTGETFYQNRYFVDDWLHRVLVFSQMFAIASIGITVSRAFGDLFVQFTIAYVITRLILVLMYVRSAIYHPESRLFSLAYVFGFSLGIAIWLGSLFLPGGLHWVGWLVGISFELAVPLTPWVAKHRVQWGADLHHLTERYGIFTIIVLGESFVKILDDAQGAQLTIPMLYFSVFGLIVVYSLWWLYFEDTASKLPDISNNRKGVAWVYGHLPLAISLVAFGVGAKKVFGYTVDHVGDALNPSYRILYTGAIVTYLVALALIDYGLDDDRTTEKQANEAITHLVAAGIIGVFGFFVSGVTANQFITVISIVMLVQVGISIRLSVRAAGNEHAHPPATDEATPEPGVPLS